MGFLGGFSKLGFVENYGVRNIVYRHLKPQFSVVKFKSFIFQNLSLGSFSIMVWGLKVLKIPPQWHLLCEQKWWNVFWSFQEFHNPFVKDHRWWLPRDKGASINYVDKQRGERGLSKCQWYLFSKHVNEGGRGGVKNSQNSVNVVYGCP